MTSSASCEVVRYRPEHRDQIVRLQLGLWSPYRRLNDAYLDWKHLRNPYAREPLIYVATIGGRVVGMRGFTGSRWLVGSPPIEFAVPCAGDLIIERQHRNQGLVATLMDEALRDLAREGFQYTLSLSAGSLTLVSQIATGWRSIGPLALMERPAAGDTQATGTTKLAQHLPRAAGWYRRLRGVARARKAAIVGAPRPRQFELFDERCAQANAQLDDHIVLSTEPRPREMAELAVRLRPDGRIRHVQDEEFFSWRFQNPLSSYRFLYWRDSRLQGYLVLRASVVPWRPEIGIVLWDGVAEGVRQTLLRSAVALTEPCKLRIWTAGMAESQRQMLAAAGFQLVRSRITGNPPMALLCAVDRVRPSSDWQVGGQRLLNLSNWDLPMLSSEGV